MSAVVDLRGRAPALVLFGLLALYIAQSPLRIGWDAAGYVQAGDEILRGRVPFADIVDVNPPLVQFLHVAPALLARIVKVPSLAFNVYVFAAALLSAVTAAWLLRRPELAVPAPGRFATLFAFAYGNHIAWAGGHFGQREHFVVLALFPLLLLRWLGHEGHRVHALAAFAMGFAAAIALAVKPQYLLAVVPFEAVFLARHRRWRRLLGPELYGGAAVAVLYAALFVAFPTMRSEYFGHYLPLFVAGYRVYDCSFRDLFVHTEVWLALATAAGVLVKPVAAGDSRLARPLAAFLAGSLFAYLVQHKGWPYQFLPAFVLAPVAVVQVVPWRGWRLPLALAVAFLGLTLDWHAANRGKPLPLEQRFGVLRSALQVMTHPGDAAIILTTSALGPYPMQLQLGVRPGSRFAWVPLLAMFYPQGTEYGCDYRKWGEGLPAERRLLEDMAADIRTRKPVLIAAEAAEAQGMRLGCTPSDWLQKSGLLERAMGDYVPLPPAPGFEIWGLRGRPVPGLMQREEPDPAAKSSD